MGEPERDGRLPDDFLVFLEQELETQGTTTLAWLATELLQYRPGSAACAMASNSGLSAALAQPMPRDGDALPRDATQPTLELATEVGERKLPSRNSK